MTDSAPDREPARRVWSQSLGHFVDDRHALYVGWVLGMAKRHLGALVDPILDEDGNFTDRIMLQLPLWSLELVVPPPPPEWNLYAR